MTPHVVILGGGPAGCGAAYRLRKLNRARVTVVERQARVGGNSGSFEWAGQRLDYGSHRLHYTTDPAVLADIKALLGDDLQERKRRGRIRLRDRYVRFPFKPLDLLTSLDKRFALGVMRDMVVGKVRGRAGDSLGDSFADVLLRSLGPTICESFYFPYARKIWGHPPDALSGIQAQRRVTANSFAKLLKRIVRPVGAGMFYYPRQGFGQITEAYADAAQRAGADLLLNTSVDQLESPVGAGPWRVHVTQDGVSRVLDADYVWSTIPITMLARLIRPAAPPELTGSSPGIEYRAMILVYLQLDVGQFTGTDAHYFPESSIAITRLSEPKNYSGAVRPEKSTVLCAELPCTPDDAVWSMSDLELRDLVTRDIRTAMLPLAKPPIDQHVKRLRHAYPVYLSGYEQHFNAHDEWVSRQPRLLTFGRQGLFAHDNTHHALFMAYAATECLTDQHFDVARWADYRRIFATHVVED